MYKDLFKLKSIMDMSKYSLQDLAMYFESFDGYMCKIVTDKRIINFKFKVSSLPHLIGLHHIFKNIKNINDYKGIEGFKKIKSGDLTYQDILRIINKSNSIFPLQIIKNRIRYLPLFLNTLNSKNTKLKARNDKLIIRHTFIKGKYFLYKNINKNYPMFSLKEIGNNKYILETFIVENDMTLLGALEEEKIKSIELISPSTKELVTN